ncbi:MAG: hypothetical protein AAB638_02810 [Patescibacteria group bacterium]
MTIEKPSQQNESRKTLSELLPFLQENNEEASYDQKLAEATKLMAEGKMDEAIAMAEKMRGMQPTRREFTNEQIDAFQDARAKVVESLGYTVESNDGKWLTISKDGLTAQLKHFMLPSSTFGYEGGRISGCAIGTKDDWYSAMH